MKPEVSRPTDLAKVLVTMLGQHPRVAATEFHMKRRNTRPNGGVKRVPVMMHSMESNRAMVAEHRLLEEDFRSYRAMAHNWLRAHWQRLPREEQDAMFEKHSKVAAGILGSDLVKEKRNSDTTKPSIVNTLSKYRPSMPSPPGYVYQKHSDHLKQTKYLQHLLGGRAKDETGKKAIKLPLLEIDDPFGRRVHVCEAARDWLANNRDVRSYDVTSVIVPGVPERAVVYNEPDSIPCHVTTENFNFSLVDRVLSALNREEQNRK